MVKANAVVDVINPPRHGGLGLFRVECWGLEPPTDYVRIYEIQAKDENVAARQGIDRFVEEMEKLLAEEGNG